MRDEIYRFMEWLIANHPEVYDEYDWEAER